MSHRTYLLSLCFIFALAACQRTEKPDASVPELSALPALSKTNLAGFENYTMLTVQEDWKVLAWSARKGAQKNGKQAGEAVTTVSILKKDRSAWREVSELQFADSYNPRLQLHTEFNYAGKPVFVVAMQQGAAVEQMNIYGMTQGEYKLLQTLMASAFEWDYDVSANKKHLIAMAHDSNDKPLHYQWNGQQFMLVEAVEVTAQNETYKTD